jgi:hypothetical protein
MNTENYKNLVKGIDLIGESLIAIGKDKSAKQIKLILTEVVNGLGFDNPEIGDKIAMLRFAVENEDWDLKKLTAMITGASDEADEPVS